MNNKNILVSGAGIAGMALAYWLKQHGFNPTVVEHAPKLREGGYAIDFWGAGFTIAERMHLVPDLQKADLQISEVTFINEKGERKGAMNYKKLKEMMNGRAFTLLRSDLSRVIYEHLDKDTEIIFGDSIQSIAQDEDGVRVSFRNGSTRQYDLVVGADGLHSNVRRLVFGDESQFEKYYGYYTSSYTVEGTAYNDTTFQLYNVPGRQAAIYSLNEGKAAAFFIFDMPKKIQDAYGNVEKQKQILREQFDDAGWRCRELLDKMDAAPDFYFDVVSQIQMDQWYKGRVTLAGDACDCPSLLSGQGSTLAIVGAYILAGELKEANGDYKKAFAEYERIFKPFITNKQKVAQTFAKSLVPKSNLGIWLRNAFTNLMFLPFVSKLFIKQFMDDKLDLKEY